MKRIPINQVKLEEECKISGWVKNFRDKKYMIFIVLKDLSGEIQVSIEKETNPELVEKLKGVIPHSVISVYGKAIASEYCKLGGREFIPTDIKVDSLAEALPITKEASVDQKMDYRWIDLREPEKTLIFQVATCLEKAMREYCLNNSFIEIHTPKISGQSTEGGSEVFKIEYFDTTAYLTQSPQFYKQMAMSSGFERVFEFGDCFRAEKSFTSRHATEFESFDIEMSYVDSHHDVMDLEEELLCYALKVVNEEYGEKIKEVFGVEVKVPTVKFPRISYHEALKILKEEFNYVGANNDFDTESERLMCQYALKKFGSEFVFITEYPFNQRAFYSMKCDDNRELSKSYDLLWKDVEITSGAQREHRPTELRQNIAEKGINPDNMQFYIDFFRYGCPAHGGFAIGMARLVAKLLNLSSIKESTFIFRGPTRLLP
ncbi:MAG: aspartate--tRNA(Asn) ligase [Clostridia bacterium]|nr:aspartate--tRNA(Asn) ligase [Clostridia bacterium]